MNSFLHSIAMAKFQLGIEGNQPRKSMYCDKFLAILNLLRLSLLFKRRRKT